MINTWIVVALAAVAVLPSVLPRELPKFVPTCKRDDPQLNDCFRKATVVLRPYISKGIPDLNIPSVEPLIIPMIMLEQGTKAVNYKAKLKDIKVFGLSNYKFQKVNVHLDKLLVTAQVQIMKIQLLSDYDIKGRALVLPVEGNGIFQANLTDVSADVVVQCTLVKRKGVEFLNIKDVKVKLDIGGAMANFGNLFNGDPTLSQTTNAFLNENAKDIVDEVKPAVEAVVGMLIDDIASKFFKITPYDKLFIAS